MATARRPAGVAPAAAAEEEEEEEEDDDDEEEEEAEEEEEDDDDEEEEAHGQPMQHACVPAVAAEPEAVLMAWPEAKTRKKEKNSQRARQDFETRQVCM